MTPEAYLQGWRLFLLDAVMGLRSRSAPDPVTSSPGPASPTEVAATKQAASAIGEIERARQAQVRAEEAYVSMLTRERQARAEVERQAQAEVQAARAQADALVAAGRRELAEARVELERRAQAEIEAARSREDAMRRDVGKARAEVERLSAELARVHERVPTGPPPATAERAAGAGDLLLPPGRTLGPAPIGPRPPPPSAVEDPAGPVQLDSRTVRLALLSAQGDLSAAAAYLKITGKELLGRVREFGLVQLVKVGRVPEEVQ